MSAEQGSDEWLQERNGYVTGSPVSVLLVDPKEPSEAMKKKGAVKAKFADGANTYIQQLADDMYYGFPAKTSSSKSMERGNELEPLARIKFIEVMRKKDPLFDVVEHGFIKHPTIDGLGCSIDGWANDGGIIEIKCRERKGHLAKFRQFNKFGLDMFSIDGKEEKKERAQMQWNMLMTGTTHCWYIAYTNDVTLENGGILIVKVLLDEEYSDNLLSRGIRAKNEVLARYKETRLAVREANKQYFEQEVF